MTDDDLAAPATRARFAHEYDADRLLRVAPEFHDGLTIAQLREIRAFLDRRNRRERRAAKRARLLSPTASEDTP